MGGLLLRERTLTSEHEQGPPSWLDELLEAEPSVAADMLDTLPGNEEAKRILKQHFAEYASEPLDDALASCIQQYDDGITMVEHPLVHQIYSPIHNRSLNRTLSEKQQQVQEFVEAKRWDSAVFMHERPYRIDALLRLRDSSKLSSEEFWPVVGSVYTDSESIRDDFSVWDRLLRSASPDEMALMMTSPDDKTELAAIHAQPTITVYQGHTSERTDGWSWTTNERVGRWFACRFAGLEDTAGRLSAAVVDTRNIVVFFGSRNESEVLINPDVVTDSVTTEVQKEWDADAARKAES